MIADYVLVHISIKSTGKITPTNQTCLNGEEKRKAILRAESTAIKRTAHKAQRRPCLGD